MGRRRQVDHFDKAIDLLVPPLWRPVAHHLVYGQGDIADSWVGTGPNKEVAPQQLERAIGSDVLATLAQQTGLSRDEILARLSRELPQAGDRYTPDGRIPTP